MRVSTFFAATLPAAMAQVREALGPKAVVLSWRNTRGGVEISASVQAEYVAPPAMAASTSRPRQEIQFDRQAPQPKRDDLLANHFSPSDFLPNQDRPRLAAEPKKITRGLAALVKQQPTANPVRRSEPVSQAQTNRAAPVPQMRALQRGAVSNPIPVRTAQHPERSGATTEPITNQIGPSRLIAFLTRSGLTPTQAQGFANSTTPELQRALSDSIAKALRFDPIAAIPTKPLILVGPPGSGKSTCAAKLAARTIASGHEVLLVSADAERCGGSDQLAALAKRLGARFEAITTLADLNELVQAARARGIVVMIDASSACPAQSADMRATARMMDETRLEAVLCLPADMRSDDMEELALAYQSLGVKRAIATRLDLTSRRASILHALKVADLALAQVSATPYISGGVAIASAPRLAALLLEPFEDALAEDAA